MIKLDIQQQNIVNWIAYVTMYAHNEITTGSMTNPHNCSSHPILPQNNNTCFRSHLSIVTQKF